jgi:UDP-glucose 4-epimerase
VTAEGFEGQRVLVSGASGFIGSHLCERLVESGAEVHGVSRTGGQSEESGIHWWQADLAETALVRELFESIGPDTVVHLASHVVGGASADLVLPTFRSNLLTTVNILTASVEFPCRRIVLAGTMMEPDHDDPQAIAASPYAVAKWAGGAYARMFHALHGVPVVNLRLFMVYGPGQRDLKKLIPYTILSLLRGESPRLASGGWDVDWVYVDDVVEAFLAAAQVDGIEGRTLDVGSGELVSTRGVVERLSRLIGSETEPTFGALEDRPGELPRAADVKRSLEGMGWRPSISLDEGLRRTIAWYQERVVAGAL